MAIAPADLKFHKTIPGSAVIMVWDASMEWGEKPMVPTHSVLFSGRFDCLPNSITFQGEVGVRIRKPGLIPYENYHMLIKGEYDPPLPTVLPIDGVWVDTEKPSTSFVDAYNAFAKKFKAGLNGS